MWSSRTFRTQLKKLQVSWLNPLWGHRSILIDSDSGVLQPYILVVMVTTASPFFACMQLRHKRSCWRFEKTFVLFKKVVVLALWSCASLHPHALWWRGTQFLSWCLDCWAGSERFASARFQLRSRRQRDLQVYPSIWKNSALLGKLGSLSVTWRTWDATQGATHFAVLTLCTLSSWWLLFETTFGKLFSVPQTFGFVFRNQWDSKHFQTR